MDRVIKSFQNRTSKIKFANPDGQSKGILDDYAVRKSIMTKEATIGGYKLPSSDGAVNQILKTNGSGVVSWAAESGGAVEGTAVLSTGEGGGTKFLREDGDGTSSWQVIAGGGDALVANPLSQFAATTSAQLAGVISDETGTDKLVYNTSPTLVTPILGTPTSGNLSNCLSYPSAQIDHDACANFVANEHIDWTADQGAVNIHTGNIPNTHAAGSDDTITIADEAADTTCFPVFVTASGAGDLGLKSNTGLTFNAATGLLNSTTLGIGGTAITSSAAELNLIDGYTGTAANLNTLRDDSMADALHRHSELSASDGTPDQALTVGATGIATVTVDQESADTQYICNVLFGTDATPPAANTTIRGSIYIQYTP